MTQQNPFIGPRSFEYGEKLYGRDREIADLTDLIIAERIIMLYSPSGAGKTSLLKAALIPKLEEEDFFVLPMMRVNSEAPLNFDLPPNFNRFIFSLLLSLEEKFPEEQQLPLEELVTYDLSRYLKKRHHDWGNPESMVLIFDQFEEILTLEPSNQNAKIQFFAQVGAALRSHDRWAIFSLREDFIAGLDPFLKSVPTRLNTRFRLELLREAAAREAMKKTALHGGKEFADAAVIKLANDLRKVMVQQADGSFAEELGLYVEPVQLQVVCRRMWDNLSPNMNTIGESDVENIGNVDHALASYYEDRIKAVAEKMQIGERHIRDWVDNQLITESGIRGQVLQTSGESNGLDNSVIDALVNAYLVRKEVRRGTTWYELAHDRLIRPIKNDNARWRNQYLSPLQRLAALWERQNQPPALLLKGKALKQAESWAEIHSKELNETEQKFLSECREARNLALMEEEVKKSQIVKILAVIALGLAVCSVWLAHTTMQYNKQVLLEKDRVTEERNKVILFRTLFLTSLATRENQLFNHANAILLSSESLPSSEHPERPYFSEAEVQLFEAVIKLREKRLITHNTWISSSIFHPVDNTILSLSPFKLKVYDAQTLEKISEIPSPVESAMWMAISPDGQYGLAIATTVAEGPQNAVVWDIRSEIKVHFILQHVGTITDATFSKDGNRVVTASQDKIARVWNVKNGDLICELKGHEGGILYASLDQYGTYAVTASDDKTARIWDVNNNVLLFTLKGHNDKISQAAFSPDGLRIATVSADKTIKIWETNTGKEISTLNTDAALWIYSVDWSPDGKWLAAGLEDKTARIWNTYSGEEVFVCRGHEELVHNVSFSPNGDYLLTTSDDMTSRIWDIREERAWNYGPEPNTYAIFSPDFQYYAQSLPDHSIMIRLSSNNNHVSLIKAHRDKIYRMQFSPDNRLLLTASFDKKICLWDTMNGELISTLKNFEDRLLAESFTNDGNHLIAASFSEKQNIWDTHTGEPLIAIEGHKGRVFQAKFSPDGKRLITASSDSTARLWEAETGKEIAVIQAGKSGINYATFSPNSEWVITAQNNNRVGIYSAVNGEQLQMLEAHSGPVNYVAFSKDGNQLVSTSFDNTARVWDAREKTLVAEMKGHQSNVYHASFSPDGKYLATASKDGTARIWNIQTQEVVALLDGEKGPIIVAEFNSEGNYAMTTYLDKSIDVWPVFSDTQALLDYAKAIVPRQLTDEQRVRFHLE